MIFSKENRKNASRKGSWIVGALAFMGAAGVVNKCRRIVSNTCCKVKEMMHKDEE